jgi:hypothetical protein
MAGKWGVADNDLQGNEWDLSYYGRFLSPLPLSLAIPSTILFDHRKQCILMKPLTHKNMVQKV